MSDIKREKVDILDVDFGMYLAELDRPWEGTPFLLQGFVIESDEQLAALKNLCQFVYIDRTKSIGKHFGAQAKHNVAIKRDGSVSVVRITEKSAASPAKEPKKVAAIGSPKIMVKTADNRNKTLKESSFMDILTSIKNKNVTHTKDGIIFNVQPVGLNKTPSYTPSGSSIKPQESNIASEAVGFLKGIFSSNKEKFSTAFKSTQMSESDGFPLTDSEMYRITVYENEVPRVEQEMAVIYPTFEKSQLATKEMFQAVADKQRLDISTVSEVLDSMVDSISRTPDALMWLSKLKDTDDVAYGQALNVSINMMAFGSFLAFPKSLIKEMGLAGLLQDVGKINIPADILTKKGKLSEMEFEMAKLHLDESLKILMKTPDIPNTTMQMVSEHHERFDGKGYPKGLAGAEISLNSQVAGLIDTYCALTTDRSYAKSLHNQQALDSIHQMRDKEFSSELVDQLIQFLGIYPVSSLVELNTGEVAVVIQQNQVRRLKPRLLIILDANKEKYPYPPTIDLLTSPLTPDGTPYQIVKGIPPDSYGLNAMDFYA
jgi:HD-GYP domain-containing protein (c-di-GMP phosphodiesterase class II)